MARYVKNFPCTADPRMIFNEVYNYLSSEGYEYIVYDNENVFKKGNGVLASPTLFKITFFPDHITMETWMKYSILPGVHVGELSTTGFVGSANKGVWKKRINNVEAIFMRYANGSACQDGFANSDMNNNFQASPSAAPVNSAPAGVEVSRKEFIENYAPASVKKDIRNVAICCYVCAAVTLVLSCILFDILGIIQAVFLAGLGLGLHLTKNRIFAYVLFAFSIIVAIISLIGGGFPILLVVAGISGLVIFNKIEKQYKQFKGQN